MTPEGIVKRDIKRILVDEGVWYFMPVSNGMGHMGVPDFVCCVNGRFFAIEAKAGKGKTTALQDKVIMQISAAGGVALVINETNMDILHAVIQQLKETV